jgi:ketosteroid isomerase-like protein
VSERNVEIVRELFEAYRRGDHDAAASYLAPGVEYRVIQEGVISGPDAVRAMWERWESSFEEIETTPLELVDAGEHVFAAVRYSGRGRGSGIEFEADTFEVYTLADGLCVRRLEFYDRTEALAAAGLSD